MLICCTQGSVSVVLLIRHPFSSATIKKRVCERVWEADCPKAPLEECGRARCEMDLPECSIHIQESRHILERNGFSTELWICDTVWSRIPVKWLSRLDFKTGLYHLWLLLGIFEEGRVLWGAPWSQGQELDMGFYSYFRRKFLMI